jgi:DNA-binding CsgD family transcriptional regulator
VPEAVLGTVLVGDVIASRHRAQVADWLADLCASLDERYGARRLAGFQFTQGDEVQGLLHPDADPFEAVLESVLHGTERGPVFRWVVVHGEVEPGRGPATHRTGPAFHMARAVIEQARHDRDTLLCRSGAADADRLLAGTAPVLGTLLSRLTARQATVARLALLDGMRRSAIAERLGVSRPTVSVSFARGDVRSIDRLLGVTRELWQTGVAGARG